MDLRQPRADDVPELGRICYEAFSDIAESHGFPSDFPSIEFATMVTGMLVAQEDIYGVVATEGDAPKGQNFINMWGDCAGIGPISVDLSAQGSGIGRTLMDDVIAHARKSGYEMIRLCQDAFNMRSLALYASIGFDARAHLAEVFLPQGGAPPEGFRAATEADLPAIGDLGRAIYRIDRQPEVAALMQAGFPVFVLERAGDGFAGYLVGTAFGHGVALDDDAMLVLMQGAGASVPEARAFIPVEASPELYRRALAMGCRNRKTMNLMSLGPYEDPRGTYLPSVMF